MTELTKLQIDELVASPNIAELLDDRDLIKIGQDVVKGFEADLLSRSAWERKTEESMKLALQIAEAKSFPWPNASNVKFPLITIAALQYHARSYPVLVDGETPVKCRVIGEDPDGEKTRRADRVSNHMSYQIMEEDCDWEMEMDRVLITQPIVGCAFKKTFFHPVYRRPESEYVLAQDLVVNYWTKSLETAPRITHVQYMSKNDLYERHARGLFLELKNTKPVAILPSNLTMTRNKSQGMDAPESVDDSTPFEVLEQHCYIDFDQDGYAEPYIIWVNRSSKQVLRIVARYFKDSVEYDGKKVLSIKAEDYFTKFPFIPSPDGGFYDLGFGVLLGPLNQSIDTIINQLVDAGTMANTAGGFLSRGIKIRGGNSNFAPLEWKHVDTTGDDLRKGIVPLPVREPSQVMFTLLSLLINYGERIGGSVDILVGQNPGQNTPAETSRTMAEQGMKIFSGIFKRTYRSLKDEFQKLYRLNQLYLEDEAQFDSDNGEFNIFATDYTGPSTDIRPAADPHIVSDSQRMAQAQAMLQLATTTPGVSMREAQLMFAKAWKISDLERLLPDPKGPNAIPQAPDIKLQIAQMENQTRQADQQLKLKLGVLKLMKDAELNQAKIHKLEAEAVKALEEAGGITTGHNIAMINAEIAATKAKNDGIKQAIDTIMELNAADTSSPEVTEPVPSEEM
jgi:chaperonin GroES